jgi:ATP-dependent RNA helicase RhlE
MEEFQRLGLSPALLRSLADAGYEMPTKIQSRGIPIALAGRDMLGAAQTGSGKTAAFALPILQRLTTTGKPAAPRRPRALVLVPTRELAAQVTQQFTSYARHVPIRSLAVYGGVSLGRQTTALRGRVDVVIATPGRLIDHLERGNVELSAIETVVLDEADRMLDMGFEPQVRRILQATPSARQTMLFSATLAPSIERLAAEHLRDPETVEAHPPASAAPEIGQAIYPVAREQKKDLLLALLQSLDSSSVLIFTRTRRSADRLHRALRVAGHSVERLHSDISQTGRERSLSRFRSGAVNLLVATDIAARGLDIPDVSLVVNFDVPETAENYVHRIGRTGRAGRTGTAVTLASRSEGMSIQAIEGLLGERIPECKMEGFPYQADISQPETSAGGRTGRAASILAYLDRHYSSPANPSGVTRVPARSRRARR